MKIRPLLSALVLCLTNLGQSAEPVRFQTDIYPILRENCFSCHQGQRASAGLRLDLKPEVLGETNGRPVVVPGKSAISPLIHAVTSTNPKNRMPREGRPLSAKEIQKLRDWIDQGLDWDEKLLPSTLPGRDHWAFQPIRKISPPKLKNNAHPIDTFIAVRQQAEEIQPNPLADPRTLLRRLFLDLTGLPPEPEQVEAFVRDPSPKAYEAWVERLLASPHHGERWARHWLDIARWGESEGYESNHLRMYAWRYRDWVVQSIRRDLPFGDFVRQQIAGDEIEPYADEHLIATGFLASARLSSNEEDRPRQRNDILVDIVNTTANAFLGLTFQCAQCHNHKFDPFTARDYYRLQAFFVQGQPGNLKLRDPELWKEYHARRAPGHDEAVREKARLFEIARERKNEEARNKLSPESLQALALAMEQRSPAQEKLAREADLKFQFTAGQIERMLQPEEKKRYDELTKKIAVMEKGMIDPPQTFGFYSPLSPHGVDVLPMKGFYPLDFRPDFLRQNRAYILAQGDVHRPSFRVDAGVPDWLDRPQSFTGRLALAEWLASPTNPLPARVYVNRLWQYHFGRGIVETPSDFGLKGSPPTHPELLDWLASELLRTGSTRHVHRLIVTSRTYRLSSRPNAANQEKDPDNQTWWRWQPRRLEAEAIRDAMLTVSGELDRQVGGPSVPREQESKRRSLYLFQKREVPPQQQMLFDGPNQMTESCSQRLVTTVPLQALYLLNSDFSLSRAKTLAERVQAQAGSDRGRQVDTAYRLALQRLPAEAERTLARRFFASFEGEDSLSALVHYCQVLLNTNEFVYLD